MLLPGRETEPGALGRDGAAQQWGQEGDAAALGPSPRCLWDPSEGRNWGDLKGREEKGLGCKGGKLGSPLPLKATLPSTTALAGPSSVLPLPSSAAGGQS